MWLLVAPLAAKVLMVMRASGSSRPILASTPRNGVVRGSQPETTARKSSRRLTRRCPVALHRHATTQNSKFPQGLPAHLAAPAHDPQLIRPPGKHRRQGNHQKTPKRIALAFRPPMV